jgi:hypothetical protein
VQRRSAVRKTLRHDDASTYQHRYFFVTAVAILLSLQGIGLGGLALLCHSWARRALHSAHVVVDQSRLLLWLGLTHLVVGIVVLLCHHSIAARVNEWMKL